MSDPGHDPGGHGTPKPDNTPPREQLILVIVLGSVMTLFGLKFVFDSYLDREVHLTRTEHLAGTDESRAVGREALLDYREEAAATLAGGPMSIEEAMSQLGTRGRTAFVQIRPAPGDTSTAAMTGWTNLPVVAPEAPPTPTRSTFTLDVDHMPPPDPEVDAVEAAADAAPLADPGGATVEEP